MEYQAPFQSDDDIDVFAPDAPIASGADGSAGQPELIFPNLEAFVSEYLVHHYARPVQASAYDSEFIWCSSWWAHTEASSRLNALWRAWEAMRLDETMGLADWWKDYADPTMRALFASKGPFQGCTAEVHNPANPSLPVVAAPEGLFSGS